MRSNIQKYCSNCGIEIYDFPVSDIRNTWKTQFCKNCYNPVLELYVNMFVDNFKLEKALAKKIVKYCFNNFKLICKRKGL